MKKQSMSTCDNQEQHSMDMALLNGILKQNSFMGLKSLSTPTILTGALHIVQPLRDSVQGFMRKYCAVSMPTEIITLCLMLYAKPLKLQVKDSKELRTLWICPVHGDLTQITRTIALKCDVTIWRLYSFFRLAASSWTISGLSSTISSTGRSSLGATPDDNSAAA